MRSVYWLVLSVGLFNAASFENVFAAPGPGKEFFKELIPLQGKIIPPMVRDWYDWQIPTWRPQPLDPTPAI